MTSAEDRQICAAYKLHKIFLHCVHAQHTKAKISKLWVCVAFFAPCTGIGRTEEECHLRSKIDLCCSFMWRAPKTNRRRNRGATTGGSSAETKKECLLDEVQNYLPGGGTRFERARRRNALEVKSVVDGLPSKTKLRPSFAALGAVPIATSRGGASTRRARSRRRCRCPSGVAAPCFGAFFM